MLMLLNSLWWLLGGRLVLLWGQLLILWFGGCQRLRGSLLLWESNTGRRVLLLRWGRGFLESGYQSRGIHEHIGTYIIPAVPIILWWRLLQHRLLLLKRECRWDGYPCPWRPLGLLVTVRARIRSREWLLRLWLLIPIPILRGALLPRR